MMIDMFCKGDQVSNYPNISGGSRLCQIVSMDDLKETIKAVHEAVYWMKIWAVKKVEVERNTLQ